MIGCRFSKLISVDLSLNGNKAMKIENNFYQVEVSRENGTITSILDKIGGLNLILEPRLADNFKFTLPLPGKEAWQATEGNYVLGKEQQ